jgi:hypothetical protein
VGDEPVRVVSEVDAGRVVMVVLGQILVVSLRSSSGPPWSAASSTEVDVLAPVAAVAVGLHDSDLPTAGFRASAPGESSLIVTRSSGEAFGVLVRVTLPRGPYGEPVVQVAGLTWAELFAGEPVVAAQGRWLDPFASRRPAMVVDFLWRGDRCWSAFDPDGNGGLCLGTGNVLGDGGFAVFRTGPDVSMGGDDWRKWPVEPPAYLIGTNVVSVDQGEVAGRLCRKVALDYEGRRGGIALDRVTAVLLAEGVGIRPAQTAQRLRPQLSQHPPVLPRERGGSRACHIVGW